MSSPATRALFVAAFCLFMSVRAYGLDVTPPPSQQFSVLPLSAVEEHVSAAPLGVSLVAANSVGVRPTRVAIATPLEMDVLATGTWEALPDGRWLCRQRITRPGAVFLSVKFVEFELPAGATLHFVSVDRDHQLGGFTAVHNNNERRFGSPAVAGDSIVLELLLPASQPPCSLTLESASYGFRNAFGLQAVPYRNAGAVPFSPFFAVGPGFVCQRDVNCPEGAPYQDVKHACAEGYDGQYVCSGQLVNNTLQDGRYLYLTAEHCGWSSNPAAMVYYWNYENSGCGNNNAPLTFSTGSIDLYHSTSYFDDIHLLELLGTNFESLYDIYYMGWNRSTTAPTSGATLGFPDDKPLQISIDNDPIQDCATMSCGASSYGPNYWRVEDYEVGTTEGGSSGGALMDQNMHLVGVLTGGVGTNCNNFGWDEFFKLSVRWTDLQPHLDPMNSGVMFMNGWDGSSAQFLRGDSNADGSFDISDPVTTLSVLFAMGAPLLCEKSADANDDGSVNVADVVAALNTLFGVSGPLPAPSAACGSDPTADTLPCVSFPPC